MAENAVRSFRDGDDEDPTGEEGRDLAMPLPEGNQGVPIISTIVESVVAIKDNLVETKQLSEKIVDNFLISSLPGVVLDELLFSGNMPLTQRYLIKYSFLGGYYEDSGPPASWAQWMHCFVVSLVCMINIGLRGISQVYLCNNPLSGVMICIGLYLTDPKLLIYALVGTACATLSASVLCLPNSDEIAAGLTGYDGALIGCAIATFIELKDTESPDYGLLEGCFRSKGVPITCVLSALAGVVHMAARHAASTPALTLSFNICILAFLFMLTDERSELTRLSWTASSDDEPSVDSVSDYWTASNFRFFHDATARGVGQFMFISTTSGGWMVILGIAITSRTAAFSAICGSLMASVAAKFIFVVPPASLVSVHNGLYGYSAAGTCTAIGGGVFYHASIVALILGILGAILSVFMQLAVEAILTSEGLALPSCTVPFVLTTWLIMLSRSAWLDPKTEDGEDMDDILLKDKFTGRQQQREAPATDDPDEKWNTRDASQLKRRESFTAAMKTPFNPIIKKLSSRKLLVGDQAARLDRKDSYQPQPPAAEEKTDTKDGLELVSRNEGPKAHAVVHKNSSRKIAVTTVTDSLEDFP